METGIAIIFLVVGVLLSGASVFLLYHTCKRQKAWEKTAGTVVAHLEFNQHNRTMYRAQIRFTPRNGPPVVFASNFGSSKPQPEIGRTVAILYPPTAPNQAVIRSFSTLYLPGLLLAFLAACLLAISVSVFYPYFVHH